MKKRSVLCMVLVMSISILASCGNPTTPASSGNTSVSNSGSEEGVLTLRYGNAAVSSAASSANALMYAEVLEEVSGGQMKVEYIGDSALGNQAQHYAMIKEGTLDLMQSSFDSFASLEGGEDFAVVLAPYLFDDLDHLGNFVESDLCRDMLTELEAANNFHVIGICTYALPRNLSTTRPVHSIDDVRGLKIRVPNSTAMMAIWDAWGAEPQIMDGGQLYTAMESGLVEAQDNDVMNTYNASFAEVAPYYTEIEYINQCYLMFITQPTWDKLTDQQKAWVEEACQITCDQYTEIFLAAGGSSKQDLIDAGVTFIEDADIDSFKAAAEEFNREQDGKLWSAGLYEQIRAMAN